MVVIGLVHRCVRTNHWLCILSEQKEYDENLLRTRMLVYKTSSVKSTTKSLRFDLAVTAVEPYWMTDDR